MTARPEPVPAPLRQSPERGIGRPGDDRVETALLGNDASNLALYPDAVILDETHERQRP